MFNAPQVYTPGGTDRINSLQNEDVLTGTGTNATLNAVLGNPNDNGAALIMPTLKGIATVNAAFDATSANMTLDLQDSTGQTAINITRIAEGGIATVQNIAAPTANLSVSNSASPNNGVNFTYLGSALAGAADATTLTLSNVNTAFLRVEQNTAVPTEGYETINLVSSGSANTITALVAEDLATLNITGTQNLRIGGELNAAGSLKTVDASALTGALDFTVSAGIMGAVPDGATGGTVAFALTSGGANDTIRISDQVNANDTINAGANTATGVDTLAMTNAVGFTNFVAANATAQVTGVEAITVTQTTVGGISQVDLAQIAGDQTTRLTNAANNNLATFNLANATAAEATAVTIAHGTGTGNGLAENLINLDVGAGVTTASLSIVNGINPENRFNVQFNADSDMTFNATTGAVTNPAPEVNTVVNVTINDTDSESNTVQLVKATSHTGTITLTGGVAGTFLNLDTAGGNGGLLTLDTTGNEADAGVVSDLSGVNVALGAATIAAGAFAGNAIVRVGTNAASPVGAQSITMGSGDDTVIFDMVGDNRAGLTISDTVAGGTGSDRLAIDGTVAVNLGASEWTNVTGFETIHLVGSVATVPPAFGYNLTLTNELVDANALNGAVLNIVNDNDDSTTAAGGANSSVQIDARTLVSSNSFNYNGQETDAAQGTAATADRFIFADANINGSAVIDGGDNVDARVQNADVVEVRNTAVVSSGDLANISNVGTLELRSDLSVAQTYTVELNNTVLDRMDSSQAATTLLPEAFTVRVLPNQDTTASADVLNLDGSTVSNAFNLVVGGGRGVNTINLGTAAGVTSGNDNVVLWGGFAAGTYAGVDAAGRSVAVESDFNGAAAGQGIRVVNDLINLGAGNDTLTTYGAINLAGATLTGIENLVANSAVVMSAAQFRAITSLTFTGGTTHQLRIIGDGGAALDLTKISVAGGTLVFDTRSNVGGVDGAANATSGAVPANAAAGVVDVAPVNGGGNALTNVTVTAGGTFTGTAGQNDNFVAATTAELVGTTITGTAADNETLTITGALAANYAIPGTVTNIDNVVLSGGTAANTLSFTAGNGVTRVTGSAAVDNVDVTNLGLNVNVDLGAGTAQTLTLGTGAYTGNLAAGAGVTDTLSLAAGASIAGAGVSGFENLTLAATGVYTMTAAQYNAFTGTVTAGNTETLAFTTAGTIVANAAIERFTLANGTNTFTAGTNTVSVVGGTGADTFNYTATQIAGATTLDGGTGSDVLNVGAIGANLNISALVTGVETVNVTGSAATGYTFTNENGAGVVLNFSKGAAADVVVLGTGGQTVNLLGTAGTAVTVTANTGVDTINLSATATGAETVVGNSTIGSIDSVANFKQAGADVFKTGTNATTLNILTIASAETATLAAAIQTAATAAGATLAANTQAYVVTVSAGGAAGTYALQNIGGTVGTVDATDFLVKLVGTTGAIVAGDFIA